MERKMSIWMQSVGRKLYRRFSRTSLLLRDWSEEREQFGKAQSCKGELNKNSINMGTMYKDHIIIASFAIISSDAKL